MIAPCEEALGDAAARDRAAARTRDLRSRITERQEAFAVDIAQAQLLGQTGHPDAAIAALRNLIAEADRRQWLAWSVESRLALSQPLDSRRDPSAAAVRTVLEATARTHGFNWLLMRLHDLAGDALRGRAVAHESGPA